jgi:glycosyltransferase involved in cell wall biosynthesis
MISVIIPFYKNLNHLTKLLKSLNHSMSKSSFTFELIIVNDSPWIQIDKNELSTFFSQNIIITENDKNMGVAYSRNIALKIAKGNFIHLIDQDDLIHRDFYKELEYKKDENLFCVYNTLYSYPDSFEHLGYYLKPEISYNSILKKNIIRSPGQVVFSRSLLNENTIFPITYHKGADDRFFWINLTLENNNINFKYIHKPYYIACIHDDNYSHDLDNLCKSCIENWFLIRKNKKFNNEFELKKDIFLYLFFLKRKIKCKNYIFLFFGIINFYFSLNKIIVFLIKKYRIKTFKILKS